MQKQVGYILLVIVLGLLALGTVMLSSTSAKFAPDHSGEMYYYVHRQICWLLLGGIVCVLLSRTDYHWLIRHALWGVALAVLLLLLVFVPGLGRKVKGSVRWIQMSGFTFQPSEFAKVALILFLAHWMTKHQRHTENFVQGFLAPGLVLSVLAALVLRQGDLGMTAMLVILFVVVMFCAGARKRYLFPVPVIAFAGLFALACLMPQRRGRLLAFLDPEAHKLDTGYQVWQALIALGSGGPNGLGLGKSRQIMNFLPESPTDFIFPIVGEELGMWIALAVVAAFLILILCSGWITLHAPDPAGVFLGIGLTTMLAVQALINLAVVTSLMPNKGMPLPFISYGGSNLLVCLAAIGILFNLQRQGICAVEKNRRELFSPRNSPRM
jgi:cell division protein FtsW